MCDIAYCLSTKNLEIYYYIATYIIKGGAKQWVEICYVLWSILIMNLHLKIYFSKDY